MGKKRKQVGKESVSDAACSSPQQEDNPPKKKRKSVKPVEDVHQPVSDTAPVDIGGLMEDVKRHLPDACILNAWEKRPREQPLHAPPLTSQPVCSQLKDFMDQHSCSIPSHDGCPCAEHFLNHLGWSSSDQGVIEKETQGQHKNENWHTMRRGLVTASKTKSIVHSTDRIKTAKKVLHGMNFAEQEELLPPGVKFGRKNEQRALTIFFQSHRCLHGSCTYKQPGLVVSLDHPFLGASPDAIGHCRHRDCGRFLVEVKCLFSDKNSHPKIALKNRNFCEWKDDGTVIFNKNHDYYYQLQCQMAVTRIHRGYLCAYTKKGVEAVQVTFDPEFWGHVLVSLKAFWKEVMFPLMCKELH